jgi:hypothetical protein
MKNAPLQDEGRLASAKRSDGLKHFDRWMFGKFHDMAIKRHTFSLLFLVVLSVSLLLLPAFLVFTPLGPSAAKWIINGGTHWNITLPAYSQWPVTQQFGFAILIVLLLAFAWVVRYFVVEYVGDVAIYVSSYKVSRFDAVRDKILQEACSVARHIYSAGISDDSHPAYDSVDIVGHSLGSVVSYDTLNACIHWDQIECASARRVVPRTRASSPSDPRSTRPLSSFALRSVPRAICAKLSPPDSSHSSSTMRSSGLQAFAGSTSMLPPISSAARSNTTTRPIQPDSPASIASTTSLTPKRQLRC